MIRSSNIHGETQTGLFGEQDRILFSLNTTERAETTHIDRNSHLLPNTVVGTAGIAKFSHTGEIPNNLLCMPQAV